METVFTCTGWFHSEFEKPFITWDNSMNHVILKSLYSGVSNSYDRHSKYRFPERCVNTSAIGILYLGFSYLNLLYAI